MLNNKLKHVSVQLVWLNINLDLRLVFKAQIYYVMDSWKSTNNKKELS